MKLLFAASIAVLAMGMVRAEESRAVPQPRLRLDPARMAAVSVPVAPAATEAAAPLMMDRLIVKERSAVPQRRREVEDPVGTFSPLGGGRLLRRDGRGLRFEAGIWPTIEVFEDEARFKESKTLIRFDFLRLKW